jgi:putative ABC transport system permease protein
MIHTADMRHALDNLRIHKLRSFLTMLGMIFGVGAVIAMLSIGAGAESESLDIIDAMGLRNIIIRDREIKDENLKKVREESLGLLSKGESDSDPDPDGRQRRRMTFSCVIGCAPVHGGLL